MFFFNARAEVVVEDIFSSRQEVMGESIYRQVRGLVNKLKKELRRGHLFQKGKFDKLVRFIKNNNIDLAVRIVDDYQRRGGQAVDKLAKRLRRRLLLLNNQGNINTQNTVEGTSTEDVDTCPGSGFSQIEFFSTNRAFAALTPSGAVITWGSSDYGADSSEVAEDIGCGVVNVYSMSQAFAALKSDGSVVTWGDDSSGGDSSSVASDLTSGVTNIVATQKAFAAIKSDGSLIVWGDSNYGGETSIRRESYPTGGEWTSYPIHSSLLDGSEGRIIKVVATDRAFSAIWEDRTDPTQKTVFAWGDELYGGDLAVHSHLSWMKDVSSLLETGVRDLFANSQAVVALKNDGSVVSWGRRSGVWGKRSVVGAFDAVSAQLQSGVVKIFSTEHAFAALKNDGSVVSWGDWGPFSSADGNLNRASTHLQSGVVDIVSAEHSFAAIKSNGSMVAWGKNYHHKGASPGVSQVVGSKDSFALVMKDGSVSMVGQGVLLQQLERKALTSGVVSVVANNDAYAALKSDGSVVTWGWRDAGGDLPVQPYHQNYWNSYDAGEGVARAIRHIHRIQSGVVKIASTEAAFVALKSDGTIVTWGATGYGADSSTVASLFGTTSP